MNRKTGQPMTFWDYAFMIGGPAAFLLVAVLGMIWLLGPAPPPNPIELIRNKAVHVGMTSDEVESKLGTPKSKVIQPDGAAVWTYHHGTADPYVEDDADLSFSPGGYLTNISLSKSTAPVQPAAAEKTTK